MDRFLIIFVGNMKVHTRKLDGMFQFFIRICSDLTIRIPNIQMFFVIQHELIVRGKHVVRSDHRVLGTLNRWYFWAYVPQVDPSTIANISSKISLFTTDPTHYEKTVLNQVSIFLCNIYRSEQIIILQNGHFRPPGFSTVFSGWGSFVKRAIWATFFWYFSGKCHF